MQRMQTDFFQQRQNAMYRGLKQKKTQRKAKVFERMDSSAFQEMAIRTLPIFQSGC